MLPLIILMFWIGLYPRPYLNLMQPTVNYYVSQMQERHKAYMQQAPPSVRQAQRTEADNATKATEGR
jgi:hypothetical protein